MWAGVQPRFFQRSMTLGELTRWPALLVEVGGGDQLLHQAQLVVGVEDGEIGLKPDQLGVAAEHPRGDRVEGAEPGHALDRAAGDRRDALLHLARGLVGEGHGEDLARPGAAGGDEVGEAGGQRRGLAGAGPGENQHRAFGGQHGLPLRRIEARQIGRLRAQGRGFGHRLELGIRERNGNREGLRGATQPLLGAATRHNGWNPGARIASYARYPRYPQAMTRFFRFRNSKKSAQVTSGDRDGSSRLPRRPATARRCGR